MSLGEGAGGTGVPVRWSSGAACSRESTWRRLLPLAQQAVCSQRARNSACAVEAVVVHGEFPAGYG
eukprot:4216206-Prorocentrum_lima.AAC.1